MTTATLEHESESTPLPNGSVTFTVPGVQFTETSLLLPANLTLDQWQEIGFRLQRIHKAWKWWVGDWINYGEHRYGEKYAQAMDATGIDYGQLRTISYVARQVEPLRRRDKLSWSHHAEVAKCDPETQDALLLVAEEKHLQRQDLRDMIQGPPTVPEAGSTPVRQEPLLTFCPADWTVAQVVTAILRVCFPDARDALDVTYGGGGFWDGSAHVSVTALDINPNRSPGDAADFRDLPHADGSFDVVTFDPPHLADGGDDSIMAQRFGTYTGDELERVVLDGAQEAWRVCRLGIIVKVTDAVHGRQYVPMSDWVRGAIGDADGDDWPVPYQVVHHLRDHPLTDPKWGEQCSAYSNGSTYLIFRKGSQEHVRRVP